MRSMLLLMMVACPLLAQGCVPSNLPFIPPYDVEVDLVDTETVSGDGRLQGHFTKGTVEVVTTVGKGCAVQLKLGQCQDGEEVWVNFKVAPAEASCTADCYCEPTVWARIQNAVGGTLPLAGSMEATRGGGVWAEVLAGAMKDADGDGLVRKHTGENRIAVALASGYLDVYAADDEQELASGVVQHGRLLADLDGRSAGGGWIRGNVDGVVNAQDGMPVGPRCGWTPAFLAEQD